MKSTRSRILFNTLCFTLTLLFSVAGQGQEGRLALTEQMVNSTNKFLQSLSSEQRQRVEYSFTDEERLNWHFIPRTRQGLPLKDMNDNQTDLVSALMKTFVSARGFDKVQAIRSLESVLAEIEQGGRFVRDPDGYYITVFGEPALDGSWAFRYEGHHLSLNWTFVEGVGIASSPQFFGTNPAEVRDGPRKGLRVLAVEEDLARRLVKSLNASQRSQAILEGNAPRDIFTSADKEVSALEDVGVSYQSLNSSQRAVLMELIEEVASTQPDVIASERLAEIRANAMNEIKFVWIGGTDRGDAHYYRVQGAGFLIEYDNTQNNANHVHLVWRDFNGDFGRDLIRLHYDAVALEHGAGHNH